jgi:hypothetical protein
MLGTASSFKLRTNTPEGRKAISCQPAYFVRGDLPGGAKTALSD